jgi:HK97 family phage prohead protease
MRRIRSARAQVPAGRGGAGGDRGHVVEGYASLFGKTDQGGDVVQKGAYAASLKRLAARGGRVKMLWQHDPGQPIGVWDEVREDATGLWVKGRILTEVEQGPRGGGAAGRGGD